MLESTLPTGGGLSPITVQPVPAAHPYVRHVMPVDPTNEVVVREDPPVPGAPAHQWWPPRALDAERLAATPEHAPDVLHVHFGFEHYTPAQLAEALDAVHRAGSAVVVTVHDLQNPHLSDQAGHLERLGVLVRAAERLITLTHGAAAEVRDRWGRDAVVVPHPHVVPLADLATEATTRAPRETGSPVRIGVHAKDLRANLDPLAVLAGLRLFTDRRAETGQEVDVRFDVQRSVRRPELMERLREEVRAHGFRLWQHDRLDDAQLTADLRCLDVSLLPYRWGTHSGWIEMCRDLGVPVAISDIGFVAEQGTPPTPGAPAAPSAVGTYALRDAAALADALEVLVAQRDGLVPATREGRRAQREDVAAAHLRIWREAVAEVRA